MATSPQGDQAEPNTTGRSCADSPESAPLGEGLQPMSAQEADEYIDRVWDDVLADIAEMVSHESVARPDLATPEDPHGPGSHEAMRAALDIAARLGLDPHDCAGQIGFADLAGEREEYLATIAHCDVVPAGDGWTGDPFEMRERDGFILGRGVLDDKGPLVLSLYAAHFFVERTRRTGCKLPYTLRAIIGCDEEVGCSDVAYYLAHYPEPAFLFTPDADFPVGVGEKGHLGATFVSPQLEDDAFVEDFEGGAVTNAIPGRAQAIVRTGASDLPAAPGIDIVAIDEGHARIVAQGKGGHASMPAGTVNAIGMIVSYLRDRGFLSPGERPYFDLLARIFASTDGSTLGIGDADEIFGKPTCIGGTMRLVDGHLEQTIDTRYTTALTSGEIFARLEKIASEHGASLRQGSAAGPYVTDPDSLPVKELMRTYDEVCETHAEPFTMGGGTYARLFAHAVSFGPNEHAINAPDWVGPEHGPDEGFPVEQLRRALKIYILSIDRLMRLSYDW